MIVSKEKMAAYIETALELKKIIQKLQEENAELKRGKEAVETHYKELELRCEELENMLDLYQSDASDMNDKIVAINRLFKKYRSMFEDAILDGIDYD